MLSVQRHLPTAQLTASHKSLPEQPAVIDEGIRRLINESSQDDELLLVGDDELLLELLLLLPVSTHEPLLNSRSV